jgi:hypothetical protein
MAYPYFFTLATAYNATATEPFVHAPGDPKFTADTVFFLTRYGELIVTGHLQDTIYDGSEEAPTKTFGPPVQFAAVYVDFYLNDVDEITCSERARAASLFIPAASRSPLGQALLNFTHPPLVWGLND